MRLLRESRSENHSGYYARLAEARDVAHRTYYGVGDGVGEVASTAGDGVGEPASAAGNTASPDIFALFNLPSHWRCKSSGPSCRWASRSCFAVSLSF